MQIIPCRAALIPSNITAILYFDVQLVLSLCLPFAAFLPSVFCSSLLILMTFFLVPTTSF